MKQILGVWAVLAMMAAQLVAETGGDRQVVDYLGGQPGTEVLQLWPGEGRNPGDERGALTETVGDSAWGGKVIRGVSQPSLVVIPASENGPAASVSVVYAPGGGYGALGVYREPAAWAAAIGADFAYLKYSVPAAANDAGRRLPLADAQRAVRLLRARAKAKGAVNHKVVVLGVSAGGHLAVSLANNHGESVYESIDAADQLSPKPDAVIGLAAAYLSDEHLGLGEANAARTAPIFLTIARPDSFVRETIPCVKRLREAKVPVELHVYPHGSHASGFTDYPSVRFVTEAGRFLKDQGVLSEAASAAGAAWADARIAEFANLPLREELAMVKREFDGLPEAEWTEGDARLEKLRDGRGGIVSVWPGDGLRADDPRKEPEVMVERSDGRLRIGGVIRPTMQVWLPKQPNGRAVLIFPGGGYKYLAAQHEGTEIAEWLNTQGITAFILKYRTPKREIGGHLAALQDAQRAIRVVRAESARFGVDPAKIGVMGFSAGGNLAALTIHQADTPSYKPLDVIDTVSARPDFAVLVYPAYLTKAKNSLEMADDLPALAKASQYPPVFATAAADDPYALGAVRYALHAHEQKVSAELHLYARGGHGKGIAARGYPFSQWAKACERWLDDLAQGTTHRRFGGADEADK